MERYKKRYSSGQALVVLLFYMIIAITLSTTAVAVIVSNSLAVSQQEEGNRALSVAEAGAENAILQLMRNTAYTGETLIIDDGRSITTVSGTMTKSIVSTGIIGKMSRAVQVGITINNGILSVTSWQEL